MEKKLASIYLDPSQPASFGGLDLELISRSFHVDHPFAKAMDFAIHKRRMSGMVVLLNRWIVHAFPQLYPVKMVFLSSIREYGSCFWCDG